MSRLHTPLEVLGITVPLSLRQEYHDDGRVDNLVDYLGKLRQDTDPLTPRLREFYAKKLEGEPGLTISMIKPWMLWSSKKAIHIGYLQSENELVNIHTRARQETEALRELGCLRELEKILKNNWDLTFYGLDEKIVADIGGVYGLFKKGYHEQDIQQENIPRIKNALAHFQRYIILPKRAEESDPGLFVPRK
ncbi:MAG: hypothetical protein Q8R47_01655 [Nanoarchaeota archaeon]|nr:hypothetical protein [Nanoarchaeota archaeon]